MKKLALLATLATLVLGHKVSKKVAENLREKTDEKRDDYELTSEMILVRVGV